VEQFKNNKYEKNFFRYNMEISQNEWYSAFLIKALKNDLKQCQDLKDSLPYRQKVINNLYKLNYYIEKLNGNAGFGPIEGTWKTSLNIDNFNSEVSNTTGKYLDSLAGQFQKVRNINTHREDAVSKSLKERIGSDGLIKLKNNYYNKQLENVVLDRLRVERYIETDSRIIQKYDPGYMIPLSKSGRAHFYAPYKLIADIKIDTYWFNLIVLWLSALAWYAALYFNLLQKLVDFIENVKIKNSQK
jgi:ABC transport system ATP-binding/permease protein